VQYRERISTSFPADGGGGDFLLLQAPGRQARAGAGGPEERLRGLRRAASDYPSTSAAAPSRTLSPSGRQYQFRTGKWGADDYNFETPSTNLMANVSSLVSCPEWTNTRCTTIPRVWQTGRRRRLTKLRMEEEEAARTRLRGKPLQVVYAGRKFKVASTAPVRGEEVVRDQRRSSTRPIEPGRV